MAEGLFAVANLFSFIRICFLLPANQQLGPLQISLGNMITVICAYSHQAQNLTFYKKTTTKTLFFLKDIMKFCSIFTIIFLAFVFAVNNLFWYYQYSVRSQIEMVNITDTINAEVAFGT